MKLHTDRWIEIDLYWFDRDNVDASGLAFWDRYHPLYAGVDGWKGVIVNVGWLGDVIFDWSGDLESEISLPKEMRTYPWFEYPGRLSGTTRQKMELWTDRLRRAEAPAVVTYPPWTYGDLKRLASTLRRIAFEVYGIADFRVGTFLTGWRSIYNGEDTSLCRRHPNTYNGRKLNVPGTLNADSRPYGAFPDGIPDGIAFTEFFGRQWGNLSKTVGLNALVFRDSCLGVGIYSKTGPFGLTGPEDPADLRRWSEAYADWVRQTKIHNPDALVIGYSNAASGVADWRVNCFDLESVANEGYLDAWIDQTWAGAWNEVGERPGAFWARQHGGWTYQLYYLLARAAALAGSNVHHYFLTETFDAWESWDIIHGARQRLKWGMWAYSHAAVKTPDGLKLLAGTYISWGNKGKELLSEADVAFLAEALGDAISDAEKTTRVHGPTIVYNRHALARQNETQPAHFIKEWIDEQMGTVAKWSIPCLSITRVEYLGAVESDLFVFQTPVHLPTPAKKIVMGLITSGRSVAVFGSPGLGVDPEIADLCGVSSDDVPGSETRFIGTLNCRTGGVYASLPNTFPIHQQFTRNEARVEANTVYSVDFSPCLTVIEEAHRNILFWDPPEFSANHPFNQNSFDHRHRSLDQIIGSPVPFVLVARLMNELGRKHGALHVETIDPYRPLSVLAWSGPDGRVRVLTGNLEEGINHDEERSAGTVVRISNTHSDTPFEVADVWHGSRIVGRGGRFVVTLAEDDSRLFVLSGLQADST
jgi:hypothetical protein